MTAGEGSLPTLRGFDCALAENDCCPPNAARCCDATSVHLGWEADLPNSPIKTCSVRAPDLGQVEPDLAGHCDSVCAGGPARSATRQRIVLRGAGLVGSPARHDGLEPETGREHAVRTPRQSVRWQGPQVTGRTRPDQFHEFDT